jgi:hypothetical protein
MVSLLPPTERPADIDAAFRQISVDLIEQEARQEAEDAVSKTEAALESEAVGAAPAPDAATADVPDRR